MWRVTATLAKHFVIRRASREGIPPTAEQSETEAASCCGGAVLFRRAHVKLAIENGRSTKICRVFPIIDGLEIFYREAGPWDAPAVLLLHGFPSSSRNPSGLVRSQPTEVRPERR